MFKSLPFTPRQVRATERRLEAIYTAAYNGLKGNSLAVASGMLPEEFNQLKQLDPVVELAILKGRADSELQHSRNLSNRSHEGDAKASLAILQHQHGWTAKQDISINVHQISITQALEEAQSRVIEGLSYAVNEVLPERRAATNERAMVALDQGRS